MTSEETYYITNVENIESTANHTNVENTTNYINLEKTTNNTNIEKTTNNTNIEKTTNRTNYTNVENVSHANIVNVNTVKKYEEVKYLEFDLVYKDYVKKHNRKISELLGSSGKSNSSGFPKVVVVQPDLTKGLGNRIPAMVCGFIYSLVSDRLFFIDGYDNFTSYFEKDFEHDWKIVSKIYENATSRFIHKNNRLNDFTLIATGNFSHDKTDVLYLTTWDYACAPITSNPYYKNWFDKLIPDFRVFTAVSLNLLRLNQTLSKQVETFAVNNFTNYNIGIHLREKKKTHGLKTPVEHFSEAVKLLMFGMKNMNITIFVAADSNNGRDKLVNLLHEITTYKNNSIKVVHTNNNMDVRNPHNTNTGTEESALIDMKLLSLCDDLVITYGSSFGFVSSAWSLKASRPRGPFVIMPIKNSSEDFYDAVKVWVWGATVSEPCMYLSKWLIDQADKNISKAFKSNPLWMHYSQCHWPL